MPLMLRQDRIYGVFSLKVHYGENYIDMPDFNIDAFKGGIDLNSPLERGRGCVSYWVSYLIMDPYYIHFEKEI